MDQALTQSKRLIWFLTSLFKSKVDYLRPIVSAEASTLYRHTRDLEMCCSQSELQGLLLPVQDLQGLNGYLALRKSEL